MNNNDTLLVPVAQLSSSKLNPRTHFDETHIQGLAASLAKDGLLENLIVRPSWCIGLTMRSELEARYAQRGTSGQFTHEAPYEIVSGECRYRAAKKAGIEALSCRVRLLTDPELEEINLTEQMHRNQLTPIEEAKSFARLLLYRNEDGTPRHTAETLAKSISKTADVVYHRLQLLKLPSVAAKAMEAGKLPMTIATQIARIPDATAAAEATKAIIKGNDGEPMSARQALAYISENCMKSLAGAPFDQADATLVQHLPEFAPHASCHECPFRTGNNKAQFGDVKRGDICTRPACYAAKCDAHFARAAEAAKGEGATVLTPEESEKEFPSFSPIGELAFNSPYAKLNDTPAAHLLKPVVEDAPTYRELVEKLKKAGMTPTVYLAKDQAGKPVELVMVEQIVAGAEKAGEPVFREKAGPRAAPTNESAKTKQEQKRLAAEAAVREKVLHACVKAVIDALASSDMRGVWEHLIKMEMKHGSHEAAGWRLLAKVYGWKAKNNAGFMKAVKALPLPEQCALMPILIFARILLEQGIGALCFEHLAEFAGVKLKAIEKDVRAASVVQPIKKKKASKQAPPRTIKRKRGDAGARAVAAVMESRKKLGKRGAK